MPLPVNVKMMQRAINGFLSAVKHLYVQRWSFTFMVKKLEHLDQYHCFLNITPVCHHTSSNTLKRQLMLFGVLNFNAIEFLLHKLFRTSQRGPCLHGWVSCW